MARRGREERKNMIKGIVKIQRWYRRIRIDKTKKMDIKKAKSLLLSLFKGWKTRKIVNALAKEIQDYVNCEDHYLKQRL
jgi:hypothetical protein